MKEYQVMGIMSGSSLDGLDVCQARFISEADSWSYEILQTETLALPEVLRTALHHSDQLDSLELYKLDARYGEWIGQEVAAFVRKHELQPEVIGLHGHTVFHEPAQKISIQIGNGLIVSQLTQTPVVDNFRAADVIKGGQGAPLVPVGEHYLFGGYAAFINLGGIANIAVHGQDILAWDIAPCNQVLNYYAQQLGYAYDAAGSLARAGHPDPEWLQEITSLQYFNQRPPKSLSNQWKSHIINSCKLAPKDALSSYCQFLAKLIAQELLEHLAPHDRVLLTGGGTFNNFLIQGIKQHLAGQIALILPSEELINYKEALIFGFLGLLRRLGMINVFRSVTGAETDSVSGTIHIGYR